MNEYIAFFRTSTNEKFVIYYTAKNIEIAQNIAQNHGKNTTNIIFDSIVDKNKILDLLLYL